MSVGTFSVKDQQDEEGCITLSKLRVFPLKKAIHVAFPVQNSRFLGVKAAKKGEKKR